MNSHRMKPSSSYKDVMDAYDNLKKSNPNVDPSEFQVFGKVLTQFINDHNSAFKAMQDTLHNASTRYNNDIRYLSDEINNRVYETYRTYQDVYNLSKAVEHQNGRLYHIHEYIDRQNTHTHNNSADIVLLIETSKKLESENIVLKNKVEEVTKILDQIKLGKGINECHEAESFDVTSTLDQSEFDKPILAFFSRQIWSLLSHVLTYDNMICLEDLDYEFNAGGEKVKKVFHSISIIHESDLLKLKANLSALDKLSYNSNISRVPDTLYKGINSESKLLEIATRQSCLARIQNLLRIWNVVLEPESMFFSPETWIYKITT
jgi:hypothetical protein